MLADMFVRYYVNVPLSFGEAEGALLRRPEDWVPGLAREAEARGELLMAEVGFGSSPRAEKRVAVRMGTAVRFPSKTVLPMSWKATGAPALFPDLDADIEVASLGPDRTQLSLSGRYRPPLGVVGRVVDRTLLHRVAEATIKDFIDRAAEALQDIVRQHAGRR